MTNRLARPVQQQQQPQQQQSGQSRSQSSTPSMARKDCPSPAPQFDARKLRNGRSKIYQSGQNSTKIKIMYYRNITIHRFNLNKPSGMYALNKFLTADRSCIKKYF